MNLDTSGVPTDAPQEDREMPKPHRFGEFVVPENAHIKGFSGLLASTAKDDGVWKRRMRESFRPQ